MASVFQENANSTQGRKSMTFVTCITKGSPPKNSSTALKSRTCVKRRRFLFLASSALLMPKRSDGAERNKSPPGKDWSEEELCYHCEGRGEQVCTFCEGSGLFVLGESNIVEQAAECPNCLGDGTVKCPACIGLGLADINGILRDGARDGRLRMKRDGTFDILDCSAFPSCAIYGHGASQKNTGIQASNFTSMSFLKTLSTG